MFGGLIRKFLIVCKMVLFVQFQSQLSAELSLPQLWSIRIVDPLALVTLWLRALHTVNNSFGYLINATTIWLKPIFKYNISDFCNTRKVRSVCTITVWYEILKFLQQCMCNLYGAALPPTTLLTPIYYINIIYIYIYMYTNISIHPVYTIVHRHCIVRIDCCLW